MRIVFVMRKWFVVFCLIGGIFLVGKGWHFAKGGFHFLRVRAALPSLPNPMPISQEIAADLNQPFFYLGQGRQYYVFSSEDGKYVLKLPRLDRYEVPFWLAAAPFPFLNEQRKKMREQRKRRLELLLESARIAFEELQEETGVLLLHFHATDGLQVKTTIRDRIGRVYGLDLDRTAFVLQEKKDVMADAFDRSFRKGDLQAAKEILSAFLRATAARAQKGVYNKDHFQLLRNYGFDGSRGFEIDIGTFYREPANFSKTPFRDTVEPIGKWLFQVDPVLADWFVSQTDRIEGVKCDP